MENQAPSGTMEKSALDKLFDLGSIPAETFFFFFLISTQGPFLYLVRKGKP